MYDAGFRGLIKNGLLSAADEPPNAIAIWLLFVYNFPTPYREYGDEMLTCALQPEMVKRKAAVSNPASKEVLNCFKVEIEY
jgi:hypothetical protein